MASAVCEDSGGKIVKLFEKIKAWWDEKCPIIPAEVEYGPVSYDGIGGVRWYKWAQVMAHARRKKPRRPVEKAPKPFETFGNGNAERGNFMAAKITNRLKEARKKHPIFAPSEMDAWLVIEAELEELKNAILHESEVRQMDEALDVATTVIRFLNREYRENLQCGIIATRPKS